MSTCAFLFPLISPGENKAHKIANLWAKMLLRLTGIRVSVIGRENVLMNRPQIFMANHQSDFDILIVLAHIPGQFRWIVKKELFKIPIFGKAMKSAGYIEIDRQNHEKAMKSLEEAAQKIREGKSVVTFPEGTRSKDGTIKPFKQGLFHLAIQAGVPIVPISIIGAHEIMPKRTLKIKPGKITMIIDRPVDVSGYTIETRGELIERVRGIIIRNFENGRSLRRDASRSRTVERRLRDPDGSRHPGHRSGAYGTAAGQQFGPSGHRPRTDPGIPSAGRRLRRPPPPRDAPGRGLLSETGDRRTHRLADAGGTEGGRSGDGCRGKAANRRMVLWIVIATFLTGVIGILFKDRIERLFESVETTACMLFITGILLFLSDRVKTNERRKGDMNLKDGIVLGLVQAVALIPGISRSGSTITFGIFRGLERETAARFSFLLSIPAIGGAVILKSADLMRLPAGDLPALGAGFLAAAVTGFLSLKLLFAMINKTGLAPFAWYCWFVGAATLIIRGMG